MKPEPKCPRCGGWALEPDHYPAARCSVCGGDGRPPATLAATGDVPTFLTQKASADV